MATVVVKCLIKLKQITSSWNSGDEWWFSEGTTYEFTRNRKNDRSTRSSANEAVIRGGIGIWTLYIKP